VRAHRAHALDVLAQRGPADLHLDRAKAALLVLIRLPQQRRQREVEVDAAGVARHARVEAAEHAPERRPLAPRAQVPQRDVDGRHRQYLGSAPAAVVERPPHRLPDVLDALGLVPGEQRRQLPRQQRQDRGATGAHGVGIAGALGAVGVADAGGDQLETADGAVRAVRERQRERDPIVIGPQLADQHAVVP
jgi:hypothetical protein